MRQASIQAMNAVGSANRTGAVLDFRQIYRMTGQVIVGAGAATAGSLKLQYSNDPAGSVVNVAPNGAITGVVNWTDFGTAVTVSGAAIQGILFYTFPWADVGFCWVRAVYTDSSSGSGAGLITVNLNVQGF